MLVATLSIPPEALALEHASSAVPEIELEAERVAAHSTEWVMPCLWISHESFDAVDEALRADPSVATVVESEAFDETAFYHVEWTDAVERRINSYVDKEGSILEARLADGTWEVDIRFADREQFDDFRDDITERGHSFQLLSLSEPTQSTAETDHVTPTQREALVTATNQGYFRVPREATIAELASELEISHQAVSELLRRGTENLVSSTLLPESQNDRR